MFFRRPLRSPRKSVPGVAPGPPSRRQPSTTPSAPTTPVSSLAKTKRTSCPRPSSGAGEAAERPRDEHADKLSPTLHAWPWGGQRAARRPSGQVVPDHAECASTIPFRSVLPVRSGSAVDAECGAALTAHPIPVSLSELPLPLLQRLRFGSGRSAGFR